MRALQIRCFAKEVSVKRLRNRLSDKEAKLKTYKDGMWTLGVEVTELREKLSQLEANTRWAEELEKANTNLVIELEAFRKQME